MTTQHLSYYELMIQGFQAVNRELKELTRAIELLAKTTAGGYHDIEGLKIQIASLAEGLNELEVRVVLLETHIGTQKWLVRQSVTVAVAVGIVLLWGWLR